MKKGNFFIMRRSSPVSDVAQLRSSNEIFRNLEKLALRWIGKIYGALLVVVVVVVACIDEIKNRILIVYLSHILRQLPLFLFVINFSINLSSPPMKRRLLIHPESSIDVTFCTLSSIMKKRQQRGQSKIWKLRELQIFLINSVQQRGGTLHARPPPSLNL